ncbi:MAG: hypothetical protein WCW27_03440 [Patescibacteria group bacterium]|jgi:hypothetical protein
MSNITSTQTNPLESFVDYLITEAGYNNLPENFQLSYREQLLTQVYRRIGLIVVNELPEQDVVAFNQLVGENPSKADQAAVNQFLESHIENFSEKLKVGLDELAKNFLETGKK